MMGNDDGNEDGNDDGNDGTWMAVPGGYKGSYALLTSILALLSRRKPKISISFVANV